MSWVEIFQQSLELESVVKVTGLLLTVMVMITLSVRREVSMRLSARDGLFLDVEGLSKCDEGDPASEHEPQRPRSFHKVNLDSVSKRQLEQDYIQVPDSIVGRVRLGHVKPFISRVDASNVHPKVHCNTVLWFQIRNGITPEPNHSGVNFFYRGDIALISNRDADRFSVGVLYQLDKKNQCWEVCDLEQEGVSYSIPENRIHGRLIYPKVL